MEISVKATKLACLILAAGTIFPIAAHADKPKVDPAYAAKAAQGVAHAIGLWGDEMSKIFKTIPDPNGRKSEIDKKNRAMKDGLISLQCNATSDFKDGEAGIRKAVIDQLDQKLIPIDVTVKAACNSSNRWEVDITFSKFLNGKVTVAKVVDVAAEKARLDAAKRLVEGYANKWENDISLWVEKWFELPDCGNACKNQIVSSTEVAVQKVHAVACDPQDENNTLPNSTVKMFNDRANRSAETAAHKLAKGKRRLIQFSAKCEGGKLVLEPQYAL
jgi:hypothetical protein